MPHYKDGTEAKVGDFAKGEQYGKEVRGQVVNVSPGSDTCNMTIASVTPMIPGKFADGKIIQNDDPNVQWQREFKVHTFTMTCKECEKIG